MELESEMELEEREMTMEEREEAMGSLQ
ncbi:hypothetical protein JTE90_001527, partial [Oedothorax gibbosus]